MSLQDNIVLSPQFNECNSLVRTVCYHISYIAR
jgi:hypothetical protein